MTMPLYAISDDLIEVQELLFEAGGELTPEIESMLDKLTGEFDDKVERICHVIQSELRAGEAAKAEARRLDALAHARSQAAANLKRYLMREMVRVDRRKLDLPTFRVRVQANGGRPRIEWTRGLATLPVEYRRVEIMLNSEAAYDHWKTTGSLPDGFVVERGEHLRIA